MCNKKCERNKVQICIDSVSESETKNVYIIHGFSIQQMVGERCLITNAGVLVTRYSSSFYVYTSKN